MALTIAAARTGLDSALTGVTHVRVVHRRLDRHLPPAGATAVTLSRLPIDDPRPQGHQRGVATLLTAGPPAGAGVLITHWRFTTASTGGTARHGLERASSPAALVAGGQIRLPTAPTRKLTPALAAGAQDRHRRQ